MEEVRSEIRPNMENLLFCHHALTQDQGGDHDCIENASAISRELVRTGVRFVFHGHTHRADSSVSTEYATEFGCGSLSQDLTDMPGNIPNQFSTGQCLDGKLVCVDRWTDVDDGNGSFSHEILYPDPEQFIDPDQFLKETIPTVPEPYIMRRVLPHENTLEDAFTRAFSDIKEVPLMEAWKQHAKILLLSDAGQGKSTELQYVAHELYDTPYFPVLIPLRDYNGGPISSLLPGQYKNLLPSRQALLFDGYDELTPDCRIPFEKELRSYLLKKPAVRVLISSRSNFCKSETGNASHTFPGFIVYTLQKLLPRDVSAYLSSRGINPKRFYSEAAAAKIEDLLDNPFYVCRLADIFLQESALPCRKDIMEKVISLSFLADDAKFQVSLEEQRYALFQLMERVSLAMQLMRKFSFDDGEEYQRLFTPEQRELVKLSGLLARVGTTWQFTHNNFREYLAARYLSRLPLEQALHYFSDGNAIKPSWYNVLGYLTSLTKGDELGLWLRGHTENPQMTVGELTALRIDFGLYSPLLTLQFCMDRYVRADVRAESFFDQVHWEEFIIREAAAVLENKQDLHPTVAQAESLSSLVCKMIDGGAFENALHFENDRITFSSLTRSLVFLAVYLDCPLRIPELLQMTEFPASWFSHNDFTSKIKYDYLGRKVPSVELNQRIAENLTSGQIGFIFQDHIGYCRDVRCEYAVDTAKDLCINTPGDDSIRYTALRYLYELLGHEYIETDVVPYADTPLLYTIATTYKDVSREVLRKAMEPQYTEKPSLGLQAVLITFNSSVAIKDYVSTVQKNHALPEGDTEYGRGPTAAISTISDPKYLPDLGELVEAVYDPAFQDRDFQGLRNGLMTAFINCSRQNAEETLAELNRHHPGLGSAERNVFFYNYTVEEILRTQRLDRDQPWPIEEVESFLRESCRST